MVGETLDVLREPTRVERLHRFHDPRVNGAAAFVQDAAVGDLVGQRVLERVFGVRE